MKKIKVNYVPDIPNRTPDYYCTWQTQLYATSDGKPEAQRAAISEKALFGDEKPFGWTDFYPDARRDLFFVMDDSWDVPLNDYKEYHGSMVLNRDKFPSYADEKNPQNALARLNEDVRKKGWRAVGGWVCAQESPLFAKGKKEYWTERLLWCRDAGVPYWKVDWGKNCRVPEFREWLTALAHEIAPEVMIESALVPSVIPHCDVFRTYDVPAILSIPCTMAKLEEVLHYRADGFSSIINCEDEAYIGAALGCSLGIMRHPYAGVLPDGRADMSFPAVHRNLKTRIDEVTRAVRWHRITPAFSVDGKNTHFSKQYLTDSWKTGNFEEEFEAWWPKALGLGDGIPESFEKSAPSAISRNMPLPEISGDILPFTVCAKNPGGAVSIATLGRTIERRFFIPECDIKIDGCGSGVFGIFGRYKSLTILGDVRGKQILAQDLKADYSFDITEDIEIRDESFTVPGEVIETVGNSARTEGDHSDAGMLLMIR